MKDFKIGVKNIINEDLSITLYRDDEIEIELIDHSESPPIESSICIKGEIFEEVCKKFLVRDK